MRTATAIIVAGCVALTACGEVTTIAADASSSDAHSADASAELSDANSLPDARLIPDARVVPDAQIIPHTVFVSQGLFPGQMGGLDEADALCQASASEAGLATNFRAILTQGTQPLSSRITITGPVRNVAGVTLVANAADFFAGTNMLPNNMTEHGQVFESPVVAWIGGSNIDCDGWRNGTTDFSGALTYPTGTQWTSLVANTSCVARPHIQCISQ